MTIGFLTQISYFPYLTVNKTVIDMKIQDFFRKFPDETSCKEHFKTVLEVNTLVVTVAIR